MFSDEKIDAFKMLQGLIYRPDSYRISIKPIKEKFFWGYFKGFLRYKLQRDEQRIKLQL
jgi:hypothetical protein